MVFDTFPTKTPRWQMSCYRRSLAGRRSEKAFTNVCRFARENVNGK